MSPAAPTRAASRRAGATKIVLGLLAVGSLLIGVWVGGRGGTGRASSAQSPGVVRVTANGSVLAEARVARLRRLSAEGLERWVGRLPASRRERRGRAVITFQTDRRALERRVRRAISAGGRTFALPAVPVASATRLPIVKQALRNNCETAALSMLLAARGRRADQLALQRQLPRSQPLDPTTGGEVPVWGDPNLGFVGRPDGGGPSGGYGVYQRPIRDLARRRGADLKDLSGSGTATVYRRLLSGSPIMVWVGLSDGPYMTWRTEGGRRVTGNFGEHTVVLTGIRGDELSVNDPLTGVRTSWTKPQFEVMWRRLGRRALSSS